MHPIYYLFFFFLAEKNLLSLLQAIRLLLARGLQVHLSHIADWMRWSLSLPLGMHTYHAPPEGVGILIARDIAGTTLPPALLSLILFSSVVFFPWILAPFTYRKIYK